MPKKMDLDKTWSWAGEALGPGTDVIVPDAFPDTCRAPNTYVTTITQADADAERMAKVTPAGDSLAATPGASLTAGFTANEFIAALAKLGTVFPEKAAGDPLTLREAVAALGADLDAPVEERDDSGAASGQFGIVDKNSQGNLSAPLPPLGIVEGNGESLEDAWRRQQAQDEGEDRAPDTLNPPAGNIGLAGPPATMASGAEPSDDDDAPPASVPPVAPPATETPAEKPVKAKKTAAKTAADV